MKNKTGAKIRQSQTNPIPDLQAINRIRSLIRFRNRDLLLFDLALETGSPASQLLQLKVCDLQGLNVGDEVAALGNRFLGSKGFYDCESLIRGCYLDADRKSVV